MVVLFVLPYVPSRIRVRPYHFIRELARRHELSVLALGDERDAVDVENLRAFCQRVEIVPLGRIQAIRGCGRALFRGQPLQAGACRSDQLVRRLQALIAETAPDVVHVEHLRAAYAVDFVPERMPRVYDSVDSISLLQERTLEASHSARQRLLARVELGRTRAYESSLLRRFDQVVVTSPVDARALKALDSRAPVSVVPNGVDLGHFAPLEGTHDSATLVLSGKMSYHANVTAVHHFVEGILPLIRRRRPDVRLRIVGSDPPPSVRKLALDPRIEVTGRVDDMRDAIGRATVAVCPVVVKVGIQNKLLEAMALGLPVVSTREGAEGIEAKAGRDYLVADDPAGFADDVCRLLGNAELRAMMGRAGREYVETHHRWDVAAERLMALYRQVIDERMTVGGKTTRVRRLRDVA